MPGELIDDDSTTGADLNLPESRPWRRAIRSAEGPLWMAAFLLVNYVAFGLAMGVHGAGFDDCEAMPTPSDRRTMAFIAAAAVVVSIAHALWRLRRWSRLAALAVVALSALLWFVLLSGSQECGLA